MAIRAVLFDLDDTLIVDEVVSSDALRRAAESASKLHGTDATRFMVDAARLREKLWRENPSREYCEAIGISFEEVLYGNLEAPNPPAFDAFRDWSLTARQSFFEQLLRLQEVVDEDAAEALAGEFLQSRRKLQRLMPDAREVLARLKKDGLRLGLLTNGAPSIQREKLSDSGLESAFDAVIVSGEHGVGKPEPRIFEIALAALGVSASETVMVGNSLQRDILGARKAGLAGAVWLKVAGSEEPAEVVPDLTLHGLHELPARIADWKN